MAYKQPSCTAYRGSISTPLGGIHHEPLKYGARVIAKWRMSDEADDLKYQSKDDCEPGEGSDEHHDRVITQAAVVGVTLLVA